MGSTKCATLGRRIVSQGLTIFVNNNISTKELFKAGPHLSVLFEALPECREDMLSPTVAPEGFAEMSKILITVIGRVSPKVVHNTRFDELHDEIYSGPRL